jgi:hypothetical protein
MREILSARTLTRPDEIVLAQVADTCPIAQLELAIIAAHRTAAWPECRAIGAAVRRKLVGLLSAGRYEVPDGWQQIRVLERETALDAEQVPASISRAKLATTATAGKVQGLTRQVAAACSMQVEGGRNSPDVRSTLSNGLCAPNRRPLTEEEQRYAALALGKMRGTPPDGCG